MSDSLRPHGLQHARLPCPSPTLRACSNSCPSDHLILCLSLLLLLSTFPSTRVFSNESVIASGDQGLGASASASASVLPMNIQGWFPLQLTGLIPGIEPRSPTLQADSLTAEPQEKPKPKNTRVGSLSLLQMIFPTQELNWGSLKHRWIPYQ